jgi:hypothetical protein
MKTRRVTCREHIHNIAIICRQSEGDDRRRAEGGRWYIEATRSTPGSDQDDPLNGIVSGPIFGIVSVS